MRQRLLALTFGLAALLLLSRPAYAAHFCIDTPFSRGASNAEMIFSGKITKVERVETDRAAIGQYVVTFKVERWWKGTPASGPRVLWRSSFMDCDLPVGEVGDDYLVYADPSLSTLPGYKLPEVTFLNRTAKLPASRKAEMIVANGFTHTVISRNPPLNRTDASNDIDLLLTMRECGCLQVMPSPISEPSAPIEASAEQTERASQCLACLRRTLRPF
jgi:hypothetical protein